MLLTGAALGHYAIDPAGEPIQAPQEAQPAQTPAPRQDAAAQTAQRGEDTITPTAQVTWRYAMACGHEVSIQDAQPVVGKTRAELAQAYGADAVVQFSPARVEIRQARDISCPDHYVLKLENDTLTVRKTDAALKERILLTLDIPLPKDAAAECIKGMTFDSLEDINIYLEGLDG
jgi:hypothetical protein